MRENHQAVRAFRGPIEIQKVTVVSFDALASVVDLFNTTEEMRNDGFPMPKHGFCLKMKGTSFTT